jgi:protein-arginine kinase activator protein McsA
MFHIWKGPDKWNQTEEQKQKFMQAGNGTKALANKKTINRAPIIRSTISKMKKEKKDRTERHLRARSVASLIGNEKI